MKFRTLRLLVIVGLLALVFVPSASAALPANMSWVKYAGNPVVPTNFGGITGMTPARPAVLVESANSYRMYFTTHPGTDGAQIYLATTSDGGLTWSIGNSGNPVLLVGSSGAWDAIRVVTPSVIKDGGTYKMWYSGRNAAAQWAIGYATSPDGTTWTKDTGNPVLTKGVFGTWDSEMVREPSVIKVGGTYHMYYSGTNRWPYFQIGHATSSDGVAWTRDSGNPVIRPTLGMWDANEAYAPSVVVNGGAYEMFYSGNVGGAWLTGHATASDPAGPWTKDPNAIISPSGGSAWDAGDSTDYAAAILDGTTWKLFYSGAGSGGYQIGLATLANQAQLTFRPMAASLGVGATTDVYIDISAVTNLYGYQFQVNWDPAKLTATGAGFEPWFTTSGSPVPGWNATIGSGTCKFALSKQRPDAAASGSGALAKITFRGDAAGLATLTFSNDILSDIDGNAIVHSTVTGWLEVYGTATVNGVVKLQGRPTPVTAGTVALYDMYGYFAPVSAPFSATDGTWSATVPVLAGGTTYDLLATHALYLGNQRLGVAVTVGGAFAQPMTTLRGGDAYNDGLDVNISDMACIAGAFGGAPTVCGSGSSDINADGTVNILDLAIAGGNYDLTTPQPW